MKRLLFQTLFIYIALYISIWPLSYVTYWLGIMHPDSAVFYLKFIMIGVGTVIGGYLYLRQKYKLLLFPIYILMIGLILTIIDLAIMFLPGLITAAFK